MASMTAVHRHRPGSVFRIVATDLDGTLLADDLSVSDENRAALRRAAHLGAQHVIVTGRPAEGCDVFFQALDYRGLAVCNQGSQIYDVGKQAMLLRAELDQRAARIAIARIKAEVAERLDIAVVSSKHPLHILLSPTYLHTGERLSQPYAVLSQESLLRLPLDKILIRSPDLTDAMLLRRATACIGPTLTVVQTAPGVVEIVPAGFDKGTGLARVAHLLGVRSEKVVAFGDMPNDIPMLRWAGHGVAMENGHPDIQAVADEIAPNNNKSGVARVLFRLMDERLADAHRSSDT